MVQSARKMHPQIFDAKPGNNQWEVNKQATTTTTTTTKQERKGKRADLFLFFVRFAAIHSGLCTTVFHSDKYSSNLDTTHIQACALLYFTITW